MIIQPNSIVFDVNKDEYRVVEAIGSGSFGYVYKVEKISDNSVWALKTLPTNFPSQEQLFSFQNESALSVKVNHENATKYVYVHNGNDHLDLPPYIIMEYANGGTLYALIKKLSENNEFLSDSQLLIFFNQLINGMDHINTILIHRDIKPDNILINDTALKISDFGLSKIVHDSTRQLTFKGFGHLRYMAPEGWKNEKNTIQMDIYSMGITFYELATLRHPYNLKPDADFLEWQNAHFFTNAVLPRAINNSINLIISQIILKMIEKSTTKRYSTWAEIRKDLLKVHEPETKNTSIIENMINIRIGKDSSIKQEQLKKEKEAEEKLEYMQRINYQYNNDINNPLKDFIDEFNKRYTQGSIRVSGSSFNHSGEIHTKIHLISGNVITINLKILFDDDFQRHVPSDFHFPGEKRTFKKLVRPTLNNQKVLAWGVLKEQQNKGFNILLVENKDDIYGQWFILDNKNNGFGGNERVEPFAFEFNEIEKELQLIRATHIYRTEVKSLDLNIFYEFIVMSNA